MDGHHQHHHLQQLQYLNKHHHLHHPHPQSSQTPEIASPVAGGDRFPQWSVEETKELIGIRGELDQTFMETKRNKLLWEVISNKMRDKSFPRSPEQCKCKWKNLVTRFKGCETMEAEIARQQFPFYDDMQIIFTTRMQRMLWVESEGGVGGTSGTAARKREYSSDEEEENVNEELVDVSNDPKILTNPKKNIAKKRKGSSNSNNGVREVLEEFMRHQIRMESEWREGWEAREKERAEKEEEWRRKMEDLEKERVTMERMWRDREEQRRSREEMRAEKRDSLINALLAKLTRDGSL
ncbi:PREDICTED: trihelix transcription factor GT-3b-like [Camelina sativa]|uniref:Trihelix transcription factor GT-3b-like n=1 Tax=Camelina sativa TaxID=90675 RepID=A0ABM0Z1R3_CAMSA|nr:PREDICTED: trihelix transcription factor GT-3b-like [Camelina sativa]